MASAISSGGYQDPYSTFYHSEVFIRGEERSLCSQIQQNDNFHEEAQEQTQESYPLSQ